MKVLFILPNLVGDKGAATAPSSGIAYIASNLLKHNHKVMIVDMRVYPGLAHLFSQINMFQPDFIGMSFTTKDYLFSYNLINQIKQGYSHIPLIVGGPHISIFGKKVLEETKADFGIIGEGEFILLELFQKKAYKIIKGLVWRNDGKIIQNNSRPFNNNLDELPFPAYELFPMDKYIDKKIPLVTSRGCPYQCIYCSMKKTMGVKWRARSAENIFSEIKYWYNKGFTFFHITDDNFTLDIKRVEKLCNLVINSKIKIKWDLRNGIRVDRITEQMLQKMKQAGCFYFAFGIEHLDDKVLKQMKKGATRKQALDAVKIAKKVGIPFGAFFMVGLPGDTYEKFLETYSLAKELDFDEVRFYNVIPFPETELYMLLKERNILLKKPEEYLNRSSKFLNDPLYEFEDFTKEEKIKALKLGQALVMEKFFRKEFGKIIGRLALLMWKNEFLKEHMQHLGIKFWKSKRRLQR